MVAEYVDGIYEYMKCLEKSYYDCYLDQGTDIGEKMVTRRQILIDWLVAVHKELHLLQETLYLTINILDRYFLYKNFNVRKSRVQLLGVASLLIASKYEEIFPPSIEDLAFMTDFSVTSASIRNMEIKILTALTFDVSPPLPLHFLRQFSKVGQVCQKNHILAKYVMELSLLHHELATKHYPSLLAAGALAYSLMIFNSTKLLQDIWTPALINVHTNILTLREGKRYF